MQRSKTYRNPEDTANLAARPSFTTSFTRGNRILMIGQEMMKVTIKDNNAWDHMSQFRQTNHINTDYPTVPKAPFDRRMPKVTCEDLKLAEAVWKQTGEHIQNQGYWSNKLKETVTVPSSSIFPSSSSSSSSSFLRSPNHEAQIKLARAETIRELDILKERPPSILPGITSSGGTAGDRNTATARYPMDTGGDGPRSIGSGKSIPEWDAYVTVSAPFTTTTIIHAPETRTAQAVLAGNNYSTTTEISTATENNPSNSHASSRKGTTKGIGKGIDFRDEHTAHALVAQATAAIKTEEQRKLYNTKGLPIATYIDIHNDGHVQVSTTKHASTIRAATSNSAQHGESITQRRYDVYGNETRSDVGLKPEWVKYTTGNESFTEMRDNKVPIDPTATVKYQRAVSPTWNLQHADKGAGIGQRRVKLRVWNGINGSSSSLSSSKPVTLIERTANPSRSSVLDDHNWQKQFAARTTLRDQYGEETIPLNHTDATLRGNHPVPIPPFSGTIDGYLSQTSSQYHTTFPTGSSQDDQPPLTANSSIESLVSAGHVPPGPTAESQIPTKIPAEYARQATSLKDDLQILLNDTMTATGRGLGSPVPGEPGTSWGKPGTSLRALAMSPIAIDRRAAAGSRGPSRQRVQENEDAHRFPSVEGFDNDNARGLVNDVIATTHPFLAHARRTAHAHDIQHRRAELARTEVIGIETALENNETLSQTTIRGEGGTQTILLANDTMMGTSSSSSSSSSRIHPYRSSTLETITTVSRPGTVPLPGSQQALSHLHQTRARYSTADDTTDREQRTLRTTHTVGTGTTQDQHKAWSSLMRKSVNVPVTFIRMGALCTGIDYAFPVKLRNQTLFTRRFRITAAGVDDSPSVPRATLRVRHKCVPIAPGLSFTIVILLKSIEAGNLTGHVHLAADDGQHIHIRVAADILDPSRFDRARDDARATGQLRVLQEYVERMKTVGQEWNQSYENSSVNASSPGRLLMEATLTNGDAGILDSAVTGEKNTTKGTGVGTIDPKKNGPEDKVSGSNSKHLSNGGATNDEVERVFASMGPTGPNYLEMANSKPSGLDVSVIGLKSSLSGSPLGGSTTGRRTDVSSLQKLHQPGPGGISSGLADREQLSPELPIRSDAVPMVNVSKEDPRYLLTTGGGSNEAATTLLQLATEHGTTPSALLEASVAAGIGAVNNPTNDPANNRTITTDIVAAAFAASTPIVVGTKIIKPVNIDDIPYPSVTDTMANRTLQLQDRPERLGGRITVGQQVMEREEEEGDGGEGEGEERNYGGRNPFIRTNGSETKGRIHQRIGPQTSKYNRSSVRSLASKPDGVGSAASSSLVLPPAANDYMIPYGGTHHLVVPIV